MSDPHGRPGVLAERGSVAFPLISSGIYGWPKQDAVRQAVTAVRAADTRVETVIFVGYNAATTALLRAAVE